LVATVASTIVANGTNDIAHAHQWCVRVFEVEVFAIGTAAQIDAATTIDGPRSVARDGVRVGCRAVAVTNSVAVERARERARLHVVASPTEGLDCFK
jgi:hypothetical protein